MKQASDEIIITIIKRAVALGLPVPVTVNQELEAAGYEKLLDVEIFNRTLDILTKKISDNKQGKGRP